MCRLSSDAEQASLPGARIFVPFYQMASLVEVRGALGFLAHQAAMFASVVG